MKPIAEQWRLSLAAAVIAGIALAGCSSDEESTSDTAQSSPAATHPVTGEPLAAEQVFRYQALDEVSSFDPQVVEDVDGSYISRDLFEGLLNADKDGNPSPGVAERYESSNNNQTWTFYLRDDAKWSDGKPVTAGDFVYAWRRAVDPELASPYAWYMSLMALENVDAVLEGDLPGEELGVTAIDDQTLEVNLERPLPYFPQMVMHSTTFPSPQWVIDEYGNEWTRPGNLVGNGAFTLSEYVIGERTVLERNPEYWNNDENLIDRVEAYVISDENQGLTRYQAGEIDKTDIPSGQYPRLEQETPEEAHAVPALCNYYYVFNNEVAPFDDVRVRKALSYAIDRDIIVENVTQGGQFPAYTFTPELTAGFTPPTVDFATMTQEERDTEAKRLLAEAGYGPENPLSFEILFNTSENHRGIAVAVAAMWNEKLGVNATLANQEWQTFLETRGNGNFEVARGAWCGDYNEASTFLDLMQSESGYNDANYVSEEYDRLSAEAKTMADPSENYTEMEHLIAEDMPNAPVYHYTEVFMLKPYVKGWRYDDVQQNTYSRELYIVEH
ncbi:ABC transporter substrate-binding protein [Saccharospirillum sp. HFRX-1]|uniref:peptide ABC transporter substrate-binding protein n=1 Tax=unclassified Saccharospirillum TaxID=2633430 RepID=UPI0037191E15